jgi:hypothetical protein
VRYFIKMGDFMSVSCPKCVSFTRRGILFGTELLRAGLVWRIEDGTKNLILG